MIEKPDTELDECPRILLSCFKGRNSALSLPSPRQSQTAVGQTDGHANDDCYELYVAIGQDTRETLPTLVNVSSILFLPSRQSPL